MTGSPGRRITGAPGHRGTGVPGRIGPQRRSGRRHRFHGQLAAGRRPAGARDVHRSRV